MKTTHVIGQCIVSVRQGWVQDAIPGEVRPRRHVVHSVTLENGVVLIPVGYETTTEPLGDLLMNETKRHPRPKAPRGWYKAMEGC